MFLLFGTEMTPLNIYALQHYFWGLQYELKSRLIPRSTQSCVWKTDETPFMHFCRKLVLLFRGIVLILSQYETDHCDQDYNEWQHWTWPMLISLSLFLSLALRDTAVMILVAAAQDRPRVQQHPGRTPALDGVVSSTLPLSWLRRREQQGLVVWASGTKRIVPLECLRRFGTPVRDGTRDPLLVEGGSRIEPTPPLESLPKSVLTTARREAALTVWWKRYEWRNTRAWEQHYSNNKITLQTHYSWTTSILQ